LRLAVSVAHAAGIVGSFGKLVSPAHEPEPVTPEELETDAVDPLLLLPDVPLAEVPPLDVPEPPVLLPKLALDPVAIPLAPLEPLAPEPLPLDPTPLVLLGLAVWPPHPPTPSAQQLANDSAANRRRYGMTLSPAPARSARACSAAYMFRAGQIDRQSCVVACASRLSAVQKAMLAPSLAPTRSSVASPRANAVEGGVNSNAYRS
jgi:hypothetical protein